MEFNGEAVEDSRQSWTGIGLFWFSLMQLMHERHGITLPLGRIEHEGMVYGAAVIIQHNDSYVAYTAGCYNGNCNQRATIAAIQLSANKANWPTEIRDGILASSESTGKNKVLISSDAKGEIRFPYLHPSDLAWNHAPQVIRRWNTCEDDRSTEIPVNPLSPHLAPHIARMLEDMTAPFVAARQEFGLSAH